MKHHERRELVNTLTKIAREYGQTQQLRERIAHALPWDCDVDERGKTHAFTFEEIESFEAAFQEYLNLKQMGPLEDNVFMSNFLTGSKTK